MTKSPYQMLAEEYGDDIPVRLRAKLTAEANKIYEDFRGAFYLLQVVQDLTAHSQPICEDQHTEIGKLDNVFKRYYLRRGVTTRKFPTCQFFGPELVYLPILESCV